MASITWDNTAPADNANVADLDDAVRTIVSNFKTGIEESMYWTDGSAASAGQFKKGTVVFGRGLQSVVTRALLRGEDPSGTQNFAPPGYALQVTETPESTAIGYLDQQKSGSIWMIGRERNQYSGYTGMTGAKNMEEHLTEPSDTPYTARWVVQTGIQEEKLDWTRTTPYVFRYPIAFGFQEWDTSANAWPPLYNGIPTLHLQLEVRDMLPSKTGADEVSGDPNSAATVYIQCSAGEVTRYGFTSILSILGGTAAGTWADIAAKYPDGQLPVYIHWRSEGTINYGATKVFGSPNANG